MTVGSKLAVIILKLSDIEQVCLSTEERSELKNVGRDETENDVAIDAIRRLLIRRPDIVKQVGVGLVEKAFEFLDDELDHFERVKKHRPLNDEELEYGRTVLPQLVQSIVRLCSPPRS